MRNDIVLTKKHYARLREYWKAGSGGLGSFGDVIALDLTAAGLLEMGSAIGRLALAITNKGIAELQAETERERVRRRPHHDLASRLSNWLRQQEKRITWENIELMVPREEGGKQAVRPDIFSMVVTYDEKRINPCVHEVKVSRADFLADIAQPGKRAGYAHLAEVLYYAAPAGLIAAEEVPEGCGLIVEVSEGTFKMEKRAKKRKVALTTHHFMNLILKPGCFGQDA